MTFQQQFHAAPLKQLYDYWQSLRDGRKMPSRSDINPAHIVSVLPHIGLFDVEHTPRRYRIRLLGTRIVSWYGCDLTGCYLDELDFGIGPGFTFSLLDRIVERVLPGYMSGEYTKQDGRSIRYERLFMPLSNDQITVNMLLGATCRLPADIPIAGDCLDSPGLGRRQRLTALFRNGPTRR